jgi:clan AA aspartic protease
VTSERVPVIEIELAGRKWKAVIDTGFNGYLELPQELKTLLHCEFVGRGESFLAGGHVIVEDVFEVEIPFDGERVLATATFAPGNEILLGTRLLESYRLEIDFPARSVLLSRV